MDDHVAREKRKENRADFRIKNAEIEGELFEIGEKIKALTGHQAFVPPFDEGYEVTEVLANLTLAYRHIEDATTRIEKARQKSRITNEEPNETE